MVARPGAGPLVLLAFAACHRSSTPSSAAASSSSPTITEAAKSVPASAADAALLAEIPNVITTPAALQRAIRLERTWEAAGKPQTSVIDKALTNLSTLPLGVDDGSRPSGVR
jgi:hypothetical protein